MSAPSPNEESFEMWVRATALEAAARVAAGRVTSATTSVQAASYTMTLVERFEHYLNTGEKTRS